MHYPLLGCDLSETGVSDCAPLTNYVLLILSVIICTPYVLARNVILRWLFILRELIQILRLLISYALIFFLSVFLLHLRMILISYKHLIRLRCFLCRPSLSNYLYFVCTLLLSGLQWLQCLVCASRRSM